MSTAPLPAAVTVEQFLARPERGDGNFEELIEGVVYVSPNAKPRHSEVVRRLDRCLLPLEEKGYVVLGEVACRLTDYSLPNTDAAVISRERWEAQNPDEFVRKAPDLAIEVASPGNRNMRRKALLYLEHGGEQVWIVYPNSRTILVMTEEGDREAREGETVEFHGVVIPVARLFA